MTPGPRDAQKPFLAALGIAALVLAGTADERVFGLITDGQIMTRTAFSIVETGEIGIARGHKVSVPRPEGDAVTRYGMGPSLAEVLPAALAGPFERAFGTGASQTLFVLEQVLLVLLAALSAGAMARSWGADGSGVKRAILAAAVASPLWAYAGTDYSEPLQAALLGGSFALASIAAPGGESEPAPSRLRAIAPFLSGACAGLALLAKSILIVLFPILLAALVLGAPAAGRIRRGLLAVAGWLPFAALWLAFEVVRFGRPFASYEGEHFSHPPLDGLWRLTVGPNKGLLIYFPLVLLSAAGLAALLRRSRAVALAAAGISAFLLLTAATWWSWDGTGGWGPRLLVPLVPILAALAALGAGRAPRAVFAGLFGLGVLINLLGTLEPDASRTWYYLVLPRRPLTEVEAAKYPSFAYERDEAGTPRLFPIHYVAENPAFSPIRVSAWLLKNRIAGGDLLAALKLPPWRTDVPGQELAYEPARVIPSTALVFLTTPFRWPHLGMSLFREKGRADTALAYLDGLLDQALRAQDMGQADRAVEFGERLYRILPGPQTAVQLAEGLRLSGRHEALAQFVVQAPPAHKVDPEFGMMMVLAARDVGNEPRARAILEAVLRAAPRPAFSRLRDLPLSSWPAALRDLTRPS